MRAARPKGTAENALGRLRRKARALLDLLIARRSSHLSPVAAGGNPEPTPEDPGEIRLRREVQRKRDLRQ